MSYARFEEGVSDVYILMTGRGLECVACKLSDSDGFGGTTVTFGYSHPEDGYHYPQERSMRYKMLTHLNLHVKAGHKVPFHTTDSLRREIHELMPARQKVIVRFGNKR